ncbi:MAG TPA: sensor histidine kinase [Vicinamibacterales bacterium]|nr:sensor histidine kinase [Vicinamibacterales bacterium]
MKPGRPRRRPAHRPERPGRRDSLQLQSLRLEQAREEERAHIARELHDELGQVLTSLKLEFSWLVDELRRSEPKPGIRLVNKLQSLIGLIEVSIQSVRQISSDLRPAIFDHFGLKEAIEWEATKFQARTGIRCRVAWAVKQELTDCTRQLALYRILQEALTNVVRHAHAGAVRISLRERYKELTLIVRDNGRGITKAELASVESIGLLGMTERARMLGGQVTITGTPGRGTTVTVQVPVAPARVGRAAPRESKTARRG